MRTHQVLISLQRRGLGHTIRELLRAPGYLFCNLMAADDTHRMLYRAYIEEIHRWVTKVGLDFREYMIFFVSVCAFEKLRKMKLTNMPVWLTAGNKGVEILHMTPYARRLRLWPRCELLGAIVVELIE